MSFTVNKVPPDSSGGGGVSSFNTRTGAVVPALGDYPPAKGGTGNDNSGATSGNAPVFGTGGKIVDSGSPPNPPPILAQRPPNANDDGTGGPLTATGGTFDGTTTITTLSTVPLVAGLAVTTIIGTTTVASVGSATAATVVASQAISLTFNGSNVQPLLGSGQGITDGSADVYVADPTGVSNGDTVTGPGIPGGTTVLSGGGSNPLTLSANVSASVSFANAICNPDQTVLDGSQGNAIYIQQTNATGAAVWSAVAPGSAIAFSGITAGNLPIVDADGHLVDSMYAPTQQEVETDSGTGLTFTNDKALIYYGIVGSGVTSGTLVIPAPHGSGEFLFIDNSANAAPYVMTFTNQDSSTTTYTCPAGGSMSFNLSVSLTHDFLEPCAMPATLRGTTITTSTILVVADVVTALNALIAALGGKTN